MFSQNKPMKNMKMKDNENIYPIAPCIKIHMWPDLIRCQIVSVNARGNAGTQDVSAWQVIVWFLSVTNHKPACSSLTLFKGASLHKAFIYNNLFTRGKRLPFIFPLSVWPPCGPKKPVHKPTASAFQKYEIRTQSQPPQITFRLDKLTHCACSVYVSAFSPPHSTPHFAYLWRQRVKAHSAFCSKAFCWKTRCSVHTQ